MTNDAINKLTMQGYSIARIEQYRDVDSRTTYTRLGFTDSPDSNVGIRQSEAVVFRLYLRNSTDVAEVDTLLEGAAVIVGPRFKQYICRLDESIQVGTVGGVGPLSGVVVTNGALFGVLKQSVLGAVEEHYTWLDDTHAVPTGHLSSAAIKALQAAGKLSPAYSAPWDGVTW